MKKILTLLIALNCMTIASCRGRENVVPLKSGFSSIQALVDFQMQKLSANDMTAYRSGILSFREFTDSVYPHLPESKTSGHIDAEDFWGWTIPDLIKAETRLFRKFGGLKLLRLEILPAQSIAEFGPIRVHRNIGVQADFEKRLPNGKSELVSISSREIYTAVVEIRGFFKLWNSTFED